jgi:NAD(P)H-dependent FMN reductase
MTQTPGILAFAGSARTDSFNKKLIKIAVAGAQAAGAEVTLIDLRDYPLPLFDQDAETAQGVPENARKLQRLLLAHHGLMISAPEYNSSITPLLKNMIDWVSRPSPDAGSLDCFRGKTAVLMSASPGALGGLRGLVHVRAILGNIQVLVLPDQVAVPKAHEAFQEDGSLKDPNQQAAIEGLGRKLAETLAKIHA